jgi:hypothetical protein
MRIANQPGARDGADHIMVIDESSLQVLIERVNNTLDGLKKIEGRLDMMVQLQLTITTIQEQIKNLQTAQVRLFERADAARQELDDMRTDDLQPIRDDMVGNRRGLRVLGVVGSLVISVFLVLYSQWKPWQQDMERARIVRDEQISKYQFDIGQELRKDDNRLTVLEFRANNVDGKTSK